MISADFIKRVAEAYAYAEGFYETDPAKIPTVPQRAHNPGDLTDDGDVGNGFIQTSGPMGAKITIYSNDTDGWNALYRKVRRMLSGASHTYTLDMTIHDVGMKYAGDPNWGVNVAEKLGIPVTTTLADLANQDLLQQGSQENA